MAIVGVEGVIFWTNIFLDHHMSNLNGLNMKKLVLKKFKIQCFLGWIVYQRGWKMMVL